MTEINNNNSILYYLCAEPTAERPIRQHSVGKSSYILNKHNINSKTNYRQALEEKHINAGK
jgi:L-amino acid N-acyltransferase YncA